MAFNIAFDYRFDAAGFFDNADARAALEEAGRIWESHIDDEFNDVAAGIRFNVRDPSNRDVSQEVELTQSIDDLLVFVGAYDLGGGVNGRASPTGTDAAGSIFNARIEDDFRGTGPVTDFEPWAGSITFNTRATWSFDLNGPVAGASDFISTALHEMGHVLGVGVTPLFRTFEDAGGDFIGPNALAENGGTPVPMEADFVHVEDGLRGDTVLMDPSSTAGERKLPTQLDLAMLADIGYEIDGFTAQGSTPPITTEQDDVTVFGTVIDDTIDGLGGNDQLQGDLGNDTLIGGAGDDRLFGQEGDDVLNGGPGGDLLSGGAGTDLADYADAGVGIVARLGRQPGETGEAAGDTYFDIENLRGSAFADTLEGDSGDNRLEGGSGGDTYRFAAGFGVDTIHDGGDGAGDGDTIVLAGDIDPASVRLTRLDGAAGSADDADNLSIFVEPSGDRIVIEGQFSVAANQIETIRFEADGSTRDLTTAFDGPTALIDSADTTAGRAVAIDVLANDEDPSGGTLSLASVGNADNGTTEITADDQVRYTPNAGFLGTDSFTYTLSDGQGGSDTASVSVEVAQLSMSGTSGADTLEGTAAADVLRGLGGDDVLRGFAGDDELYAGDGNDRIEGGDGDDRIEGGETSDDRRDLIYAGAGDDTVDGGHGNDELNGAAGNDTLAGGFGADTVIGNAGDDVLTGSAFSDLLFGGPGADFVNGGFGFDRVNGGADGDRFFHTGDAGHGSDWIQDYDAAEGDVLLYGGPASEENFRVIMTETQNAGAADVDEAFVVFRPTGQILWALVDGAGQDAININIAGQTYDLLG